MDGRALRRTDGVNLTGNALETDSTEVLSVVEYGVDVGGGGGGVESEEVAAVQPRRVTSNTLLQRQSVRKAASVPRDSAGYERRPQGATTSSVVGPVRFQPLSSTHRLPEQESSEIWCFEFNRLGHFVAVGTRSGALWVSKVSRGQYPSDSLFYLSPVVLDDGHSAGVLRIAWAGEHHFVSCGLDRLVIVWSALAMQRRASFEFDDYIVSIDVHPLHPFTFLACDINGGVHFLQYDPVRSTSSVSSRRLDAPISCCRYVHGGDMVAVGLEDGSVVLLDCGSRLHPVARLLPPHEGAPDRPLRVVGIETEPLDWREILVSYNHWYPCSFSLETYCQVAVYAAQHFVSETFNPVATYSPLGDRIIAGCERGRVHLWTRVKEGAAMDSPPYVHWSVQLSYRTEAVLTARFLPLSSIQRALSRLGPSEPLQQACIVTGDADGLLSVWCLTDDLSPDMPFRSSIRDPPPFLNSVNSSTLNSSSPSPSSQQQLQQQQQQQQHQQQQQQLSLQQQQQQQSPPPLQPQQPPLQPQQPPPLSIHALGSPLNSIPMSSGNSPYSGGEEMGVHKEVTIKESNAAATKGGASGGKQKMIQLSESIRPTTGLSPDDLRHHLQAANTLLSTVHSKVRALNALQNLEPSMVQLRDSLKRVLDAVSANKSAQRRLPALAASVLELHGRLHEWLDAVPAPTSVNLAVKVFLMSRIRRRQEPYVALCGRALDTLLRGLADSGGSHPAAAAVHTVVPTLPSSEQAPLVLSIHEIPTGKVLRNAAAAMADEGGSGTDATQTQPMLSPRFRSTTTMPKLAQPSSSSPNGELVRTTSSLTQPPPPLGPAKSSPHAGGLVGSSPSSSHPAAAPSNTMAALRSLVMMDGGGTRSPRPEGPAAPVADDSDPGGSFESMPMNLASAAPSMVSVHTAYPTTVHTMHTLNVQLKEHPADDETQQLWEEIFGCDGRTVITFEMFLAGMGQRLGQQYMPSDLDYFARVLESDESVSVQAFGDLLKYFAPLPRLLENMRSVLSMHCFYGHVPFTEAQLFLHKLEVGTYLVRFSSRKGSFAVSYVSAPGKVTHLLVRRTADHGYVPIDDEGTPCGPEAPSFQALLEAYGGLLRVPFVSTLPFSRYFVGELTAKEAEELLARCTPGSFLVRLSSSSAGDFVVSHVEVSGSIRHVLLRLMPSQRFQFAGDLRDHPTAEAAIQSYPDQFLYPVFSRSLLPRRPSNSNSSSSSPSISFPHPSPSFVFPTGP